MVETTWQRENYSIHVVRDGSLNRVIITVHTPDGRYVAFGMSLKEALQLAETLTKEVTDD